MKFYKPFIIASFALIAFSCARTKSDVPVVGFVEALEDATLSQAKHG